LQPIQVDMDFLQHPGLKLFKKGKKFFFSIADKDGKRILLNSKAYSSKKSRDNGIYILWKNLDKLELTEKEESNLFAVKTRNNQMMAQSCVYHPLQASAAAIDYIKCGFSQEDAKPMQEPVPEKTPKGRPATETGKYDDLPPKYSFR